MLVQLAIEFKLLDCGVRVRPTIDDHLEELDELLGDKRVEVPKLQVLPGLFRQMRRAQRSSSVLLVRLVSVGARLEQIDVLNVVILSPLLVQVLLVRELVIHPSRQIIAIVHERANVGKERSETFAIECVHQLFLLLRLLLSFD